MSREGHASPLRRAREARGWSLEEAAARVRGRCPGPEGRDLGCAVDADRLHQFETGPAHPGPGHAQTLASLYQQHAADLDLAAPPTEHDQQPTTRPEQPDAARPAKRRPAEMPKEER